MSTIEKGEGRRVEDVEDEKMFTKESEGIQAAMDVGQEETSLSRRELFKRHWPAAMWSCLMRYVAWSRLSTLNSTHGL
jgi:hypothetical protein